MIGGSALGVGAAGAASAMGTTTAMIGLIDMASTMQMMLAIAELISNIIKKASNIMANSVG